MGINSRIHLIDLKWIFSILHIATCHSVYQFQPSGNKHLSTAVFLRLLKAMAGTSETLASLTCCAAAL